MKELSKENLIYRFIVRDVLVFAALWFYLCFLIDLKLIYHGAGRVVGFPTFFCSWLYFKSFIVNPGGILGYVSSFLSQTFYYSWLGSAVVTLVCWINAVLTVNILRCLDLRRFDFIRFCSVFLVVVTSALYLYQFDFVVSMMIILLATSAFFTIKTKNLILYFILLVMLSSFLYIAAGGGFYVFAFIVFSYLIIQSRQGSALIYCLLAVLTPYLVGVLVFKESVHNSYFCLTPFHWKTLAINVNRTNLVPAYIVYFSWLLVSCLVLIKLALTKKYPYLFLKKKATGKSTKHTKVRLKGRILSVLDQNVALRYLVSSVFWIIIFVLISSHFYKSKRTKFFLADYHYMNRNWSKVIEIVRGFEQGSYYMTHAACHALSQTDKLSTEMFTFPQHPHSLFLSAPEHVDSNWSKIDLDLDLGFLNMAEHGVVESMQVFGPRPILLKRLSLILLAKKDYQAAKVYLNQLGSTIFERSWAKEYLRKLKTDPNMESDSRICYLRSVMISKNYGFSLFEYDKLLTDLLEKNPENKMAYEYMMAWHLLCGNLEKVVSNFDRLGNFDYQTMPEYYQHAYLFYTKTMGKKVSLRDWEIDDIALKNYNEILKNFNLMKRGNKSGYKILLTRYKHSYLVYLLSSTFLQDQKNE